MPNPQPIDIEKELRKRVAYNNMDETNNAIFNTYFFQDKGRMHDADSVFFDPYFVSSNSFKDIRTLSRTQYGGIHCKTLRRVAEKAWIINTCITYIIRKSKPFFKPVTDRNQRGFIIRKIDEDILNRKLKAKQEGIEKYEINLLIKKKRLTAICKEYFNEERFYIEKEDIIIVMMMLVLN